MENNKIIHGNIIEAPRGTYIVNFVNSEFKPYKETYIYSTYMDKIYDMQTKLKKFYGNYDFSLEGAVCLPVDDVFNLVVTDATNNFFVENYKTAIENMKKWAINNLITKIAIPIDPLTSVVEVQEQQGEIYDFIYDTFKDTAIDISLYTLSLFYAE